MTFNGRCGCNYHGSYNQLPIYAAGLRRKSYTFTKYIPLSLKKCVLTQKFRLQRYCFFLTYARKRAILCVFCLSVISRSSLGHRSVGKRQRIGGYKQGQGTHKTIQNGQKVMWSVIYINLTRTYINFCFRIVLIINMLKDVNINRRIWI